MSWIKMPIKRTTVPSRKTAKTSKKAGNPLVLPDGLKHNLGQEKHRQIHN